MDYSALATLIQTHPQWPSVDDETLTTWVNEEAISRDKATLPSTAILEAILTYPTEWAALTDANRNTVRDILYIASGEGVPTAAGNPIRAQLVALLGAQTKALLATKIAELISRAENAGVLGTVRAGDISYARTLIGG